MENHFKTTDLILAAVILTTINTHLIVVKKKNSKEVEFIFKKEEAFDGLVDAYEKDDIRIEPASFIMVLEFVVMKMKEAKKN